MPRHNLFALIFAIGLINAMIRPIRSDIAEFGFVDSMLGGFGISFIVWFAIFCVFDLLYRQRVEKITRNDSFATLFTLIMLMIPSAFISWIALSLFSFYGVIFAYKKPGMARNACFIMLAIALRVPVSDIVLRLTADALLQFDAIATLFVLKFIDPTAIREGNIIIGPGGHELLIMTGCASFTNISLALLLWFTVLRTQITYWRHRLTLYILPLVIMVMGVNIARLALMARSTDDYFFYHDGMGADIVNALVLVIALGMAVLSLLVEKQRKGRRGYETS